MTNKKLLLLQFRDDISAAHEVDCFLEKSGLKKEQITVVNAITDTINQNSEEFLKDYFAVIMGGSGQYDLTKNPPQIQKALKNTKNLFDYIFQNDFPTLAVCFGHQLMAHLKGGRVKSDKNQSEVGEFEIFLTDAGKKDFLFSNLESMFKVQCGHKDSVINLPKDFKLLASSNKCKVHAYKYKSNIYGLQFHPELDKKDIAYRLGLYPTYSKNRDVQVIIDSLKGTPNSHLILKNFVNNYLN